jgi:hypothetical protein
MPNRKKTTLGVIHVTATPPGWKGTMVTLKKMHQALGWSDTGYNEVIFPDGRAEISGRGKLCVGAHVAGFNSIAYGLSLVGGVDTSGKPDVRTITPAQWASLERRMRELSEEFPGIAWCGHRDLSPDKDGDGIIEPYEHMKACPTFDAIPYAESLGLKGAAIRGTWAKAPPVKGAEIVTYLGPDSGARLRALRRRRRHAHRREGADLLRDGMGPDAAALPEDVPPRRAEPMEGRHSQTPRQAEEGACRPQDGVPIRMGRGGQGRARTRGCGCSGVRVVHAAVVDLSGLRRMVELSVCRLS